MPTDVPNSRNVLSDRPSSPAIDSVGLTPDDLHLFNEGTHARLYLKLGAHATAINHQSGVHFCVWAPNAAYVSVIGDFNGWTRNAHPLSQQGVSGLWEGFVPAARTGQCYKYHIRSHVNDYTVEKADPFAVRAEVSPKTASVVWNLGYDWHDGDWMSSRAQRNALNAPISVYEVHLGSWRRVPEEGFRPLSYRELADQLTEYVLRMRFTHVELLPIMEHPFTGSWGYQTTGYFAPTSRQGSPQDFMHLIDALHQQGIGVILDWVPSHFPNDEHGLSFFDGTHLYEHADPRLGFHPDWKSCIFNYGRHEVRSFLISSAMFWLDRYHADGIRVDAVASMLYRDYSRKDGEWLPNEHGGRENTDAIAFLRRLNEAVYLSYPDVQTIAEESTAWPMVSRPTHAGGLGFGLKWDMGWMHDTLRYFERDPIHRRHHQNDLTFRMVYAFNENFMLPLSHDEVVHGKSSLLSKMPGDDWQKFANLRLLYSYMFALPGKKLLFMGNEIASWDEWNHDGSVDWHLEQYDRHAGIQRLITDLNRLYRLLPALHRADCEPSGFEWIDIQDSTNTVISFLRLSATQGKPDLAIVFNLTPIPRKNYRIGVPAAGRWVEVFNSDAECYGGTGMGNMGTVHTAPIALHGHPQSLEPILPPLGAIYLQSAQTAAR
ncbi:MAG TPA: 1,4-alpha-glucan branching protein GlgB [candidate division Zixibacteria bacterium]